MRQSLALCRLLLTLVVCVLAVDRMECNLDEDNGSTSYCSNCSLRLDRIEATLDQIQLRLDNKRPEETGSGWQLDLKQRGVGLGGYPWEVEAETLLQYLGRFNVSSSDIGVLSVSIKETKELGQLSNVPSACARLGGLSSELTSLSEVDFWAEEGIDFPLLKCLNLFGPNLRTFGFSTVGYPKKQTQHLTPPGHLLRFPQIEHVVLTNYHANDTMSATTQSHLPLLRAQFPALRSLYLRNHAKVLPPDILDLHNTLSINAKVNNNISTFGFHLVNFRAGLGSEYQKFCEGRKVSALSITKCKSYAGISELLSYCGRHLQELQLWPTDRRSATTDLALPPMKLLERLEIALYDLSVRSTVRYKLINRGDSYPSLRHLVLDIYTGQPDESPAGNASAILENESFLSRLNTVAVLTIEPMGLLKTEILYIEVMKKLAVWFPNLSNRNIELIRFGITNMELLSDEFVP